MAVDLHIGSVETIIESNSAGLAERERELAAMLAQLKAELARDLMETERRNHDRAAEPRSFGRRY